LQPQLLQLIHDDICIFEHDVAFVIMTTCSFFDKDLCLAAIECTQLLNVFVERNSGFICLTVNVHASTNACNPVPSIARTRLYQQPKAVAHEVVPIAI